MITFITGIDTDIGKSYATGMLARYFLKQGKKVITQKLVQTGNVGTSEDLALHRKIMGVASFPEDEENLSCPYVFKTPCSPHLAARLEGRTIEPEVLSRATERLAGRYDEVLLEGAGGPAVPLQEKLLTVDYVAERRYPVILVSSGRLGSLNHTILAIEALRRRRLELRGIVFNTFPPSDPVIAADARRLMLEALRTSGGRDVLVDLPEVDFSRDCEPPDFGPLFAEADRG